MKNGYTTKKMVTLAMLSALAFVSTLLIHISLVPAAPFLTYDPKDVILVIVGFVFGPVEAIVVSLVVSLVEMVTISDSGVIGLVMNVLSSCSFAVPAAIIYRKKRSMKFADIGLVVSVVFMAAVMCLWNIIFVPIFQDTDRAVILPMIPVIFLPFNLIKGALNAAITLLLYKPVVTGLRKADLLPKKENAGSSANSGKTGEKKNGLSMKMITLISAFAFVILAAVIYFIIAK